MENQETGKKRKNHSIQKKNPKQLDYLQNLKDLGKKIPIPGKTSDRNPDERQMNKLKRQELLQILVSQSKEIDRLKQELKETKKKLEERELKISSSGSLAEASLKIFDVLNSAQKAADLYLDNLRIRAEKGMPETNESVLVEEEPTPETESMSTETDVETVNAEDATEPEILEDTPDASAGQAGREEEVWEEDDHGTE